jgi:hypothetical protein
MSFEYIVVLYNRKRQNSSIGYKSPLRSLDDWPISRTSLNEKYTGFDRGYRLMLPQPKKLWMNTSHGVIKIHSCQRQAAIVDWCSTTVKC